MQLLYVAACTNKPALPHSVVPVLPCLCVCHPYLPACDPPGALACLCGQQGRWLVRRSAVTLGRSTDSKGEVDIDLSKAAPAVGEPPAPAAAGEPSASAPPAAGDTAAPAPAAAAADGVNAPPAPPTAAASTAAEQPAAMSDAGGVAAAGAGGGATAAGAPPTEQGPPGGGQAGTSWSGGSSGLKQVSRLQAQLLLTSAGTWSLTNTGRASLAVNGRQVRWGRAGQEGLLRSQGMDESSSAHVPICLSA